MNTLMKTAAIAAIAMSTSAPAFAAAHLDLNSMTCAQFNDLSAEDQTKVAMMAIEEISATTDGTVVDNNGTATATEGTDTTTQEESTAGETETVAANDGEATATSTTGAGNDETRMTEEMELLMRTCETSLDAMVLEAAAGQDGTR